MNSLSNLALFSFIRPPLIQPGILQLIACAAAGGVALLITYLLVRLIWRIRWKSQTVTSYVHLRNRGNVQSVIELGAYAPGRNLKFSYVLDGAVLPVRKTAALPAEAPASDAPGREVDAVHPNEIASQDGGQAPSKATAKDAAGSAGKAISGAQDKVQKVSGITALLIDILATLGSIIPGPLGQSLKQQSSRLQAQKAAILAKGQAPNRAMKQAQHLKGSVGDLKEEVGPASAVAAQPGAAPAQPEMTPQRLAPARPAFSPGQEKAAQAVRPAAASSVLLPCLEYVQLPPLAPAASVCLALRVNPANPYQRGESIFWVFTRPQDPSHPLGAENTQPQKSVQKISYPGMPLSFRLLTILLSFAAVVFNGAWVYLFVRWLLITFA
jgi:hypothetical protein